MQADRWVRKGTPPPVSYHLKMTADDQIERDANGNAITLNRSGQAVPRLPFVELGEARFLTGFTGSYDSVKSVADLGFSSHGVPQSLQGQGRRVPRGGLHPSEEAAAMRDRAGLCPPLTFTETYRDHYDDFVAIQRCN